MELDAAEKKRLEGFSREKHDLEELSADKRELLVHQINEFVAGVDLKDIRKQVSADEKLLEELWADQKHWTLGVFYHCADDPRWFVPKNPPGFGWTINMSKKSVAASKWNDENKALRGALREH